MDIQCKSSIVKSFVRIVRESLHKESVHRLRATTQGARDAASLASAQPRKKQMTQTHHLEALQTLLLPSFRPQKRKSFIQTYQQNIIKRSVDKRNRQFQTLHSPQRQGQQCKMRKKTARKSNFRVQGLTPILMFKKDAVQPRQTKLESQSIRRNSLLLLRTSGKQTITHSPAFRRVPKAKRTVTEQPFAINPWEGNQFDD